MAKKKIDNGKTALGMLVELDAFAVRLSCSDRASELEKEALQESIARSIRCLSNILARMNNFDGHDYLRTMKR